MKRYLQRILEIFEVNYGFGWEYDCKTFPIIKRPENTKWGDVNLWVRYNTLTGTKQYQTDDYSNPTKKWVTYDELELSVDYRN